MERKGGNNRGWGWGRGKGVGAPREGRLQESEMQFGSPRAAGPSDGGWGGRGQAWTPAQPLPNRGEGGQGGLGEGSWGEGGTRPEAACSSEAWGLPGHWDVGAEAPSAASARARPSPCRCEAFKDTSAPAQRGCVCVSVSACVAECVCRRVGAAAGGVPGRPRPAAPGPCPRLPPPCVFRSPRPGSGDLRPPPRPHLRRRHRHRHRHAAAARLRPHGEAGGASTTSPPRPAAPRARRQTLRGGRCAPQHSPHPRRPSQIAGTPHPQPQVAGGRSLRSAPRPGPGSPLGPPRGRSSRVPAPPGRGGPGSRGRGGGAGSCQAAIFCRRRGAARGSPPSAPCGPRRGRLFRVGVRALQRPAAGPRLGPGPGARPGRRGRQGRGPCGSA